VAFPTAAPVVSSLSGKSRPSKMPPVRLVVLDVGGTIIQDRGDVPESLRKALANHGITATSAEIDNWRGASKREIVRHFVQLRTLPPEVDREKLTEAIYADFSAQVNEAYSTVPPIAGAEEAFRSLRRSGFLLATTTGFDREITTSIFRRLGWQEYFEATITSDDVAQGRPSPFMIFHAMEAARVDGVLEAVTVGDTPLDLQAGTNAGLRGVVGVLSGAGTSERLSREPHTHILPSVADLPALLRSKF
jgi:phosphonatase-like hydrolase